MPSRPPSRHAGRVGLGMPVGIRLPDALYLLGCRSGSQCGKRRFLEDNLGESSEGLQQQRAIGEYGFASGGYGAGPDDALEPSVVFVVKHVLEHESFHVESIKLDATEGHFAWRQGAAIAEAALSQERGQVECQLQTQK